MVGPASSSGLATGAGVKTVVGASTGSSAFLALATGFASALGCSVVSSFFLADFLGRVDESIAERSILLITLVPSSSGASIFICPASATFSSTTT